MKFNKYIFLVALLFVTTIILGQQDPNYTFYRYNMNLINPAYAGSQDTVEGTTTSGGSEVGMNIKSQWAGIEGAPETQSFFFSTGLSNNVGLGVSIINDKTFIENQTFIGVDFSYRLQVAQNTNLFLGIKAGANSYSVNTSGLTTYGIGADPSLTGLEGTFSPNVGAGAYLKSDKYYVSFSVPKILSQNRLSQENGIAQLGNNKVHMYLSAGYDISLNSTLVFKPSIMTRYIEATPLSLDFTGMLSFNDRFDLGAGYRYDEGISAIAIMKVSNWLEMGYAYEFTSQSPITSGNMGTHELLMKLTL